MSLLDTDRTRDLIEQWKDNAPSFWTAMHEVAYEIASARAKFPPHHSAHEGYAVILEELDELWQEVQRSQKEPHRNLALRNEAKQVAAMAIAFSWRYLRFDGGSTLDREGGIIT